MGSRFADDIERAVDLHVVDDHPMPVSGKPDRRFRRANAQPIDRQRPDVIGQDRRLNVETAGSLTS